MITSAADLACVNADGSLVMPTGPCCAWPEHRNKSSFKMPTEEEVRAKMAARDVEQATKVKASLKDMALNFVETGIGAIKKGKVDKDTRDSRYAKCLTCPSFISNSKRCSECGCFMEAKTWIAAARCPIGEW